MQLLSSVTSWQPPQPSAMVGSRRSLAAVLVIALVFVIVNLLVDLSYAYLDPRIRYG